MPLFRFLSFIVNIYMLIIFVRIILTWFTWMQEGGFQQFLAAITDPYLNWFRRFTFLRIGFLDLSPVAALGVLSLLNRVLTTLAFYGKITAGIILALILQAVWSAVSFFLGFIIIILALRLIAFLFRLNTSGAFWRIIDTISRPVLYRIQRIIFSNRVVNYMTGIIVSMAVLAVLWIGARLVFRLLINFLFRLPI